MQSTINNLILVVGQKIKKINWVIKTQPAVAKPQGFTLVELLVVIVIVAILTAIGLVIYSQVQIQARDGSRIADLTNLKNAILLATHDVPDMAAALCAGTSAPCNASSYPTNANTQKTNGSGWVKVNFDAENVVNFDRLPLDPLNNSTYFYSYKSDGQYWKIEATLESSQYKSLMSQDGGNDNTKYEVGTGLKTL